MHKELQELVLLPKSDERWTSCMLIHGMGGTGKTVAALALVQQMEVRRFFSDVYWISVGIDAKGARIRELQARLHRRLTGKNVKRHLMADKDEEEWLGMLVEAMSKLSRALVVLDDPWDTRQVRFLHVKGHSAHR